MLVKGAKTALRAPTTTRTSPRLILRHSSYNSPSDKPLCNTATCSPKRALTCRTICGVNEISGTSIRAFLPCFKALLIACKYTSVLPLPVIPSSKNICAFLSLITGVISFKAFCCWSFKVIAFFLGSPLKPDKGSRYTSTVLFLKPAFFDSAG